MKAELAPFAVPDADERPEWDWAPKQKDTDEDVLGICVECGHSHKPENRARLIRRAVLGGASHEDIAAEWSCFYAGWAPNNAADRRIYRDKELVKP